jgi:ribonuclease HI
MASAAINVLEADGRFAALIPALRAAARVGAERARVDRVEGVTVYTDGACSGNPGPGGWGVVFDSGEEYSGGEAATTNNRMELMAAIVALERAAEAAHARLTVVTDSQYVQKGVTAWMATWKANGWQTAARKPVKNQDLWQRLDRVCNAGVRWEWVRGHAGNAGNARADALAVAAIARQGKQ